MSKTVTTVDELVVQTFVVPTDAPESDGTAEWDRTTAVVVEVAGGGRHGLGYTYASAATAELVHEVLASCVRGADAFATGEVWQRMVARCRNLGRPGAAMMAISAVDVALWDLKARLLEVPLASLLGRVRETVPIYGSGGFCSYDEERLRSQLAGWVEVGIPRVKMKVGRDRSQDRLRVAGARVAIGEQAELYVDVNGAWTRSEALRFAQSFADWRVGWLEEPVSSDDLDGLRWLRDHAPGGMQVAAGEYGFDPWYFRAMLSAGAVDVLQADATRCGGITGFLRAAAIADAFQVPLSSHCAPNLHAHVACAVPRFSVAEWFHDHVRVERMLFDGVLEPVAGALRPDLSRPGLGLELKRKESARHAA
jgi:L-alanine-DL-glutamate epimerase-like enolase superfamily enzyme